MIVLAVLSAIEGKPERDTAGEGLVRHKAQLVQIVVTIVTVTVVEFIAAETGTGKGSLIPLAIPGVEGTGIVERAVGPAEFHILEAAGAAAVLIDLLKIVIVKGNFLTGSHRVGDVTLAGGSGLGNLQHQGAVSAVALAAVLLTIDSESDLHAVIGRRLTRLQCQTLEGIVAIIRVIVIELAAYQVGTAQRFIAISNIAAEIVIIAGRGAKGHVLEGAVALAVIIFFKIADFKAGFLAGLHRIGDITLGGTGTAADFDIHGAGHIILAPLTMNLKLHTQCTAVSPAVSHECQIVQCVIHTLGDIITVIIEPCIIQIAFAEVDGFAAVILGSQIPIII